MCRKGEGGDGSSSAGHADFTELSRQRHRFVTLDCKIPCEVPHPLHGLSVKAGVLGSLDPFIKA